MLIGIKDIMDIIDMNTKDIKYFELAKHISEWSKDPSTKIGAVIIGDHGQVLSQGYNGFPRGIEDTVERWNNRESKYKYVVHAEMNAIYNAGLNGARLEGSTLYVFGLPTCSECAKGVIQTGIKRVVMESDEHLPERWKESMDLTKSMFEEAGIEVIII